MLWIALYLPELSLQVSHRGLLPDLPLVIVDGGLQRPLVIAANRPAYGLGIRPGMPVSAAQALTDQLVVQPRDTERELAALHALAAWAGQFTPTVILESEGILLEVQPSLRLFGGLAALGERVRAGVTQLGFDAAISVAPVPLAAWLLAKARAAGCDVRGCRGMTQLPARLDTLPVRLMDWPEHILQALDQLGIASIAQCRRLPRDGLIRRFGRQLVDDLDRAYGDLPDPRPAFDAPQVFFSRIELAAETDNVQWLKHPLQLLLAELEGYLRARRQAAQQLQLALEHGRSRHTALPLNCAVPQWLAADFMLLLEQHLARMELKAPVRAISLQVERMLPACADNKSLINDPARQTLAWQQLNAHLAARLPCGLLYRIAVQGDHRPEQAWLRNSKSEAVMLLPDLPRPAWLLQPPRSLASCGGQVEFEGPLALLTAPERIEAGWWDGNPVARDYYIARNPRGQLCWIYQDHLDWQWYLHGLFG